MGSLGFRMWRDGRQGWRGLLLLDCNCKPVPQERGPIVAWNKLDIFTSTRGWGFEASYGSCLHCSLELKRSNALLSVLLNMSYYRRGRNCWDVVSVLSKEWMERDISRCDNLTIKIVVQHMSSEIVKEIAMNIDAYYKHLS